MPIFGGGGDLVSRIITRYEADTSPQVKELRNLERFQDQLHAKREQQFEVESFSVDNLIGKYGKLAAGVAGVVGSFQLLSKASSAALEDSRLRLQAQAIQIDDVQRAAGGLITEYQALQLSAQGVTSDMHLQQAELEVVAMGIQNLVNQGRDQVEVYDKVKQAIIEGNVEPLKEYGIVIRDVENDTREAVDAILERFREMGPGVQTPLSEIQKESIRVGDAWRNLEIGAGKLASALSPLVGVLGDIADGWSAIIDFPWSAALSEAFGLGGDFDTVAMTGRTADELRAQGRAGFFSRGQSRGGGGIISEAQIAIGLASAIAASLQGPTSNGSGRRGRGGGSGERAVIVDVPGGEGFALQQLLLAVEQQAGTNTAQILGRQGIGGPTGLATAGIGGFGVGARSRSRDRNPLGRLGFTTDEIARLQEDLQATMADIRIGQQQSFLESAFGPIAEFNAYAQGFELLSSTATAGFRAIVTGSESLGDAIKRALGDSILSLSLDMFSQSLRHGAYALGSLAFGNVPGATAHGQAAALFAAGAAATGLIANRLGAGGAAQTGARGGSAGLTGRASLATSGRGGGSNITIISNDDPTDSPRRRAANQAARIRMAQRFGAQGVGIGGHR